MTIAGIQLSIRTNVWSIIEGNISCSTRSTHNHGRSGSDHYFYTCRPYSVRPHLSKSRKTKTILKLSLLAGLWVWPRGSLMTPDLFDLFFNSRHNVTEKFHINFFFKSVNIQLATLVTHQTPCSVVACFYVRTDRRMDRLTQSVQLMTTYLARTRWINYLT